MARFALITPASVVDRIADNIDPDVATKNGWRWLPYNVTKPNFDPVSQVREGPVISVNPTVEVTEVWTVRAKTQTELDSDAAEQVENTNQQLLQVASRRCVLTADITTGNTAFQNADGLALSLDPNKPYHFEFLVAFRSAATTTGLGLSVTAPASPQLLVYQRDIPTSLTAVGIQQGIANDGTTTNTAGIDLAATDRLARVWGLVSTGAAGGPLQLRFKSEVSGSNVQIRRGSGGFLRGLL